MRQLRRTRANRWPCPMLQSSDPAKGPVLAATEIRSRVEVQVQHQSIEYFAAQQHNHVAQKVICDYSIIAFDLHSLSFFPSVARLFVVELWRFEEKLDPCQNPHYFGATRKPRRLSALALAGKSFLSSFPFSMCVNARNFTG